MRKGLGIEKLGSKVNEANLCICFVDPPPSFLQNSQKVNRFFELRIRGAVILIRLDGLANSAASILNGDSIFNQREKTLLGIWG